jgi:hypothetical protein
MALLTSVAASVMRISSWLPPTQAPPLTGPVVLAAYLQHPSHATFGYEGDGWVNGQFGLRRQSVGERNRCYRLMDEALVEGSCIREVLYQCINIIPIFSCAGQVAVYVVILR